VRGVGAEGARQRESVVYWYAIQKPLKRAGISAGKQKSEYRETRCQ
jgi:hypothetical protein